MDNLRISRYNLQYRYTLITGVSQHQRQSEDQISRFAGNMLEVGSNSDDQARIVMSKSAFDALNSDQKSSLEKHGKLVPVSLDVIEACGGGSARCMMAEIHLPKC